MKYRPSRDIPKFIRELKTFSPTEIAQKVLTDRNKNITPESVTMWLKRHPKIREDLEKEIIGSEVDNVEVVESIFINGTFEELESVSKWIRDMNRRKIVNISGNIATLKRICKGEFPKMGIPNMPNWSLKHPDRLTQENVLQIVDYLDAHGCATADYRLTGRNFLMSCNKPHRDISGAKHISFGKHASLFVEKPVIYEMLEWEREKNFEAFVASLFMYKTATRKTATLNAKIEDMHQIQGVNYITVYDKGRRSKNPEGKKWTKHLPNDLYGNILALIGQRSRGKIFSIKSKDLSQLNRDAIDKFCPNISDDVNMPNHFWRHMFAQHMLRATGWKYGVVANLGGWTVKALEESYGKPPHALVQQWGLEFIPKI